MEQKIYDLIILGGGPASMSAGVYACQMKLDTLLIEKGDFGGQIATTSVVSNYLGFDEISGKELAEKMHEHLRSTPIEIAHEEIVKTELSDTIKKVYTHSACYHARSVIIGIGTAIRRLGVENEKTFVGKGLSYFCLKDRDKFENKCVAVVGGGNSAIEDALYLSQKAKKVYLIHRRGEFRADALLVENLYKSVKDDKIEVVLDSRPLSLEGDDSGNCISLNTIFIPNNCTRKIAVDGVFVAIGRGADTDIIDEILTRDESGYLVTDDRMQTNISGVFAVGDIRNTPLRQIVTAVSDGAIASMMAFGYIRKNK